jgi:hypothetical protein
VSGENARKGSSRPDSDRWSGSSEPPFDQVVTAVLRTPEH